jgi:hypothetical protein
VSKDILIFNILVQVLRLKNICYIWMAKYIILQPGDSSAKNPQSQYRICSRNLSTFFFILAAEKSGCVKYADFFCGGLDLDFILV